MFEEKVDYKTESLEINGSPAPAIFSFGLMENFNDFDKHGENRMQLYSGEIVYLENVHKNTILTVSEKQLLKKEEKMF